MLGLETGTVRIVAHDVRWQSEFAIERALLLDRLDGLGCEVEHVGSTAVPGLPAKPILDIAIDLPSATNEDDCLSRLAALDYEYRGDAGLQGGHLFIRTTGNVRTHHIHVVPLQGRQWRNYLRFRDLLQADQKTREDYATEKRALALEFSDDRESYTRAKDRIVRILLDG
jgi:GrpB-like predicted nucleotidyltransferase (UPF0157 family)